MLRASLALVGALSVAVPCSRPAQAQEWPEVYNPLVFHALYLEMSDADWQTIQNDETFDIEVPAMLSLDGEPPILIAIRRKSADPLVNAPGYKKVAYKIEHQRARFRGALDRVCERPALHELHRDPDALVLLDEVVNLDDVRMAEARIS